MPSMPSTSPTLPVSSDEVPFVRLQVQPGLYGVTKVRWRTWPTRSWLSWVVAALYLAAAGGVARAAAVSMTHDGWYDTARYVVTGGWVLLVGVRLVLEGTVSKPAPGQAGSWDKQLVDPWWTSIHTITGFALGLWLVPFAVVALCTVCWELLEITVPGFGDEEINGNRLTDIAVAWGGWLVAVGLSAVASSWLLPLL